MMMWWRLVPDEIAEELRGVLSELKACDPNVSPDRARDVLAMMVIWCVREVVKMRARQP